MWRRALNGCKSCHHQQLPDFSTAGASTGYFLRVAPPVMSGKADANGAGLRLKGFKAVRTAPSQTARVRLRIFNGREMEALSYRTNTSFHLQLRYLAQLKSPGEVHLCAHVLFRAVPAGLLECVKSNLLTWRQFRSAKSYWKPHECCFLSDMNCRRVNNSEFIDLTDINVRVLDN